MDFNKTQEYVSPVIEVIRFNEEDIITASEAAPAEECDACTMVYSATAGDGQA